VELVSVLKKTNKMKYTEPTQPLKNAINRTSFLCKVLFSKAEEYVSHKM
jgi:hypothetical protein